MIDTTVDVINKLGLHARASGKLIEVTTKFRSSIQIGKGGKLVDAKNIMSLLMLGAGKGTTLSLVIEGADEEKALSEIQGAVCGKILRGRLNVARRPNDAYTEEDFESLEGRASKNEQKKAVQRMAALGQEPAKLNPKQN